MQTIINKSVHVHVKAVSSSSKQVGWQNTIVLTLVRLREKIVCEQKIRHARTSYNNVVQTTKIKKKFQSSRERVRGCSQFVHGRSRMTIDPGIPTMPGRSTSGFHQPGRYCLHQARSSVRCSASRMNGELHPSKNRSEDGLRHLVSTFLLVGDSASELCFVCWCGNSRDSNGYYYVTASWVPYHNYNT